MDRGRGRPIRGNLSDRVASSSSLRSGALYTSQRSADLIRMGRQHVRDGKINVVQQKTGARLWIPIHPDLKAIMDATPTDNLTFLVSELGKPYASANSFGIRMKRWACEAGLDACSIHGLRKACCRRLAEAGCTAHEIMAISGHRTLAEVERYTRAVEQSSRGAWPNGRWPELRRTDCYPRPGSVLPTGQKGLVYQCCTAVLRIGGEW